MSHTTPYRITVNRAPQGSNGIQPADWADEKRAFRSELRWWLAFLALAPVAYWLLWTVTP